MPLVIAILVIIVLFVGAHEGAKRAGSTFAYESDTNRKTNATLEQRVMDKHVRLGEDFETAYNNTKNEIRGMGFEPCIPRDAYTHGDNNSSSAMVSESIYNSSHKSPTIYDSDKVTSLRRMFCDYYSRMYQKSATEELIQAYVYGNGWKGTTIDADTMISVRPVGTRFIYGSYGLCEVIKVEYDPFKCSSYGYYEMEVQKTGKIIRAAISDKQLHFPGFPQY